MGGALWDMALPMDVPFIPHPSSLIPCKPLRGQWTEPFGVNRKFHDFFATCRLAQFGIYC